MTRLLSPVSPDTIINRLIALPDEIAAQESTVHLLTERLRVTQELRQRAEDGLLTSGQIDGKNEAQRAAQLRELTLDQQEAEACAAYRVGEAKIQLRRLTHELSALKAVAKLLSGGND